MKKKIFAGSLGQRCYQVRLAAATATSERRPVLHQLRSKSLLASRTVENYESQETDLKKESFYACG
jgi:hypothetical protein